MNKLLYAILFRVWCHHYYGLHYAGFNVCDHLVCRFGNWLERVTGYWEAYYE